MIREEANASFVCDNSIRKDQSETVHIKTFAMIMIRHIMIWCTYMANIKFAKLNDECEARIAYRKRTQLTPVQPANSMYTKYNVISKP